MHLIRRFLRRHTEARARRAALQRLLAKPDDHLIRDIGLTRTEVEAMLHDEGAGPDSPPLPKLPCRQAR